MLYSKIKNVIVIDPWLGIADFAENVAMKYQNIFRKHLKLNTSTHVKINPNAQVMPISEKDFEALKKEFPNLILKA